MAFIEGATFVGSKVLSGLFGKKKHKWSGKKEGKLREQLIAETVRLSRGQPEQGEVDALVFAIKADVRGKNWGSVDIIGDKLLIIFRTLSERAKATQPDKNISGSRDVNSRIESGNSGGFVPKSQRGSQLPSRGSRQTSLQASVDSKTLLIVLAVGLGVLFFAQSKAR